MGCLYQECEVFEAGVCAQLWEVALGHGSLILDSVCDTMWAFL